ncbi:MAG: hypothetical protein ACT4PU_08825 [Planctomycetota bacterium]
MKRGAAVAGAVVALSAAASACPYCSLSQDTDTLLYILGFLILPYAVVSLTLLWIRRLLARERKEAV